jgi:hypothetical protein
MSTHTLKPCDLPCPKCGSTDVLRSFWAKDERRQAREYDKQTMGKYARVSCWGAEASRDHIVHHCRCCQYEWQTLPMAAPRIKKSA